MIMTIPGFGSIISLFTEHGLIDEYQFMIDPVAILVFWARARALPEWFRPISRLPTGLANPTSIDWSNDDA